MRSKHGAATVREAVGVFFDSDHLHEAVDELVSSGFRYEDLGMLAGEEAVREKLGEFYKEVNQSAEAAEGPRMAFVAKKSMGDTVHAFLGTLFFAGTTAASGAIVASAAVLGGSLLPAVAGAAAIGLAGGAMAAIIHQGDAEHLEEQLDEGHLLLFVRARNAEEEKKAVEILSRHGGFEARIYEAPEKAA